jgi:hypothetical protein
MRNDCLVLTLVLAGCAVDDVETSTVEEYLTGSNRLASNRLASNRLASNRLASNSLSSAALSSNGLIETEEGRDVFSYIVSCALPAGQSVTLQDEAGNSYLFRGEIGLAPAWQTSTPSVTDRRWVTACLLARTNHFGVPVALSMRGPHPQLGVTSQEASQFGVAEGAFFGDLFGETESLWFSCGVSTWTESAAEAAMRVCAISADGVTTTCGFDYANLCDVAAAHEPACASGPPWTQCQGGATAFDEVISIYLRTPQ